MPSTNNGVARSAFAASAVAVMAFAVHAVAAPLSSRPGEYEVTVGSEAFGAHLPAQVHRQCMTQKDMDQGQALVSEDLRQRCRDLAITRQGKAVTMSARCTAPAMTIKGEGTTEPDAFSMKFTVDLTEPIHVTHRQTVNARRLGDCARPATAAKAGARGG